MSSLGRSFDAPNIERNHFTVGEPCFMMILSQRILPEVAIREFPYNHLTAKSLGKAKAVEESFPWMLVFDTCQIITKVPAGIILVPRFISATEQKKAVDYIWGGHSRLKLLGVRYCKGLKSISPSEWEPIAI